MQRQTLLVLSIIFSVSLYGQVGVGTVSPAASAVLDVNSVDKGMLIPRLTVSQRDAIMNPATGLLIFQIGSDEGNGFYYYDAGWKFLGLKKGTTTGQMMYWNGTAWIFIIPGTNAQTLSFCEGVPKWTTNGLCPAPTNLVVGDSWGGGKVAYINQSGDLGYVAGETHGLIAAAADQGPLEWGCYSIATGGNYDAIGTGLRNTTDVVYRCNTADIAARYCYDLELNGYKDWYLPSKGELNKLYLNKTLIGGFFDTGYWSSTEDGIYNAWGQLFSNGVQVSDAKALQIYFRPVRAF